MKFRDIFGNASFVTSSSFSLSPAFKGTFVAKRDAKTEITIVGLGFFRLYINNKEATADRLMPVTSFYHQHTPIYCLQQFGEKMASRINVLSFDISSLVHDGENELTALVGPGWYTEYSDRFVLCYKIISGDVETVSDGSVLWSDGPLTSYTLRFGEYQDYTKQSYKDNVIPDESAVWNKVSLTELPDTEYVLQECPNDRVIRTVSPVKIAEKDGYSVYDVGENISGTWVFRLKKRGAKVSIKVSEALDDNSMPNMRWNHRQTAEIITDGTDRDYRLLFTWHAFRYFSINSEADVKCVEVVHTDLPVISSFSSENKVLGWLYDAYIRTQLSNMHTGIPSDCPHIERRGYTGDGQLTCETVMLTLDTKSFYRKWIGDIADCQDQNSGHVQFTAPYVRCSGGPGGWGCAIAEVPYVYYKMTGDIKPFADNFDRSLLYLDYMKAHSENGLVVSDQPGNSCLGEWCTPYTAESRMPIVPEPFVNTYFYARTCDRLIELAPIVGRQDAVAPLKEVRKRCTDALVSNYFDASTGDFAENKNSANAFALDLGLGDERTIKNLLSHIRNDTPDTGIFGYDLVVKTLFANGYFDDAVNYLSREEYPSFGHMMHSGATTLWEEWQNETRSMSHPMFGSAVKYLFYEVLGIKQRQGTVGFTSVVITPHTNDTTGSVSGSVMTPKGKITVKVDHSAKTAEITVPKGVPYEIRYDGKTIVTVE